MQFNEVNTDVRTSNDALGRADRLQSSDPSLPSPPPEADEAGLDAQSRTERIAFNTVKEELRRAELAFVSAKRSLPEGTGRLLAERIAEALRRCNLSVDTVEKGLAIEHTAKILEGASKFSPESNLVQFLPVGGRSLALAAHELARCGVASIEYWGRQLERLANELCLIHGEKVG